MWVALGIVWAQRLGKHFVVINKADMKVIGSFPDLVRVASTIKPPHSWVVGPRLAESQYVAFAELPKCPAVPNYSFLESTTFGVDQVPVFWLQGNILAVSEMEKEITSLGSSFTANQVENFGEASLISLCAQKLESRFNVSTLRQIHGRKSPKVPKNAR